MKKIMLAVMAWLMATVVVNATDIGGTVERVLNINQRITVIPERITAVIDLDLDAGTWDVDVSLNCFYAGLNGATVFSAGAVSRYMPTMSAEDGRTSFLGTVIWNGRADPFVPAVGRSIQITAAPGTTRKVFAMLWVHQRDGEPVVTTAKAYGWMHARRIR